MFLLLFFLVGFFITDLRQFHLTAITSRTLYPWCSWCIVTGQAIYHSFLCSTLPPLANLLLIGRPALGSRLADRFSLIWAASNSISQLLLVFSYSASSPVSDESPMSDSVSVAESMSSTMFPVRCVGQIGCGWRVCWGNSFSSWDSRRFLSSQEYCSRNGTIVSTES